MSGYLDDLQARLVDASRELSRARRRRVRRRGAWCAALAILLAPPALAATGVWRPQLGDGKAPAPAISADSPPASQLALLGVLRREQNEADRGVASRYALKFVGSSSITGVRTDSIRLLAQSSQDRGVVLVPVERYHRELPGDVPDELRKQLEVTIDDALCVYQLDTDGAGVACYSSDDVREGRAWMRLGRRALWIVPDGVASVRTEYIGHAPITAAAHDNTVIFSAPEGRIQERRSTFLGKDGQPIRVIERPIGNATASPPAVRAPGATRSGVVRRISVRGAGRQAAYELLVHLPPNKGAYVVLQRPACAGKRRVRGYVGGNAFIMPVGISPSFGDRRNVRWCPGTYRGTVRLQRARKPTGTFSFRVH
jgi:hypothetical protein